MITLEKLQVIVEGNEQPYLESMKRLRAETKKELDRIDKQMAKHLQFEQHARDVAATHTTKKKKQQHLDEANDERKQYDRLLKEREQFEKRYEQADKAFRKKIAGLDPKSTLGDRVKGAEQPDLLQGLMSQFTSGNIEGFASMLTTKMSPLAATGIGLGVLLGTKLIEGLVSVTQFIGQKLVESIQIAAKFEMTKFSLIAVTGSVNEATGAIERMKLASRTVPGLTFQEAVVGVQRLRAVGFTAKEAEIAILGLSKANLLSGGERRDMEAVILNFQQIRAMGRLTGDELRETLSRMPAMAKVVSDAFGTISTKLIAEIGLTGQEFFDVLLTEMAQIPQVVGGAQVAIDKMNNAIDIAAIEIGEQWLPVITQLYRDLAVAIDQVLPVVTAISREIALASSATIFWAKQVFNIGAMIDAIDTKDFGKLALAGSQIGRDYDNYSKIFDNLAMGIEDTSQFPEFNSGSAELYKRAQEDQLKNIKQLNKSVDDQRRADIANLEANQIRSEAIYGKDINTLRAFGDAKVQALKDAGTAQIREMMKTRDTLLANTEESRKILSDYLDANPGQLKQSGQTKAQLMAGLRARAPGAERFIRERFERDIAVALAKIGSDVNKASADEEKRRLEEQYRQTSEMLNRSLAQRMQSLSSYYDIRKALVDAQESHTLESRRNQMIESANLEKAQLQATIREERSIHNQRVAAAGQNRDLLMQIEHQGLMRFGDLRKQGVLLEIKSQKELRAINLQITKERRDASKVREDLFRDEISFLRDKTVFGVEEMMDRQLITVTDGYARILKATEDAYNSIVRSVRAKYDIILQEESLTADQRANIQKQLNLELMRLEFEHYKTTSQLRDKSLQEEFDRMDRLTDTFVKNKERELRAAQALQEVLSSDSGFLMKDIASRSLDNLVDGKTGSFQTLVSQQWTQYRLLEEASNSWERLRKKQADDRHLLLDSDDAQRRGGSRIEIEDGMKKIHEAEWAALNKLFPLYNRQIMEYEELLKQLDHVPAAILRGLEAVEELGASGSFDDAQKKWLELVHTLERSKLDVQLANAKDQFEQYNKAFAGGTGAGSQEKLEALRQAMLNFGSEKVLQALAHGTQSAKLYADSIEGLTANAEALKNLDNVVVGKLFETQQKEDLREIIGLREHIILLESKYYQNAEIWELRRKEAVLNAEREIWERRQEALIQIDRLNTLILDKYKFSTAEMHASLLDYLNQQKSLTEVVTDANIAAMDHLFGGIDTAMDAFVAKLGLADTAFGAFVKSLLAGLAKLAAAKFFTWLIGSLIGGATAGGGGLTGSVGSIAPSASGNWIPSKQGGHLALVGEGGYDEAIISTDPRHRKRSMALLNRVSAEIMPKAAVSKPMSNYVENTVAGSSGRGDVYITNRNMFKANENGEFRKPSASQAAKQLATAQERAMRRR